MQAETATPTDKILGCLDSINARLAAGDLTGLGPLTTQLGALNRDLAQASVTPDELGRLKSRAERQLALLGAAREGVEAARRRVAVLRNVGGELSTYDSEGHGRTLHFGAQTLEHRA